MDKKEIEIYNEIQKTMETPWYKYFLEYINQEIQASEQVVIEWWIESWNDKIYNYYDIVRCEIKYLKDLRDRLERIKQWMKEINSFSAEDEV